MVKKQKSHLKTLQCKNEQGGLKLVDLNAKQDSLKIQWIYRIQENPFLTECMCDNLCSIMRSVIWECSINLKVVTELFKSSFWREILEAWSKINYKNPQSKKEYKAKIIWYNSDIRINGKPFVWKRSYESGLIFVEDLLDENNQMYKIDRLHSKGYQVTLLQYNALKVIIHKAMKELKEDNEGKLPCSKFKEYQNCKNRSQKIYNVLIDNNSMLVKYAQRWLLEENIELN